MKRIAPLLLLLLLGCEPVIRKIVTLTFDATGEHVTVNATTYVGDAKAGTPEYAEAEERRSALLAERDEWAMRFAQADPETERVTWQRSRGKLESVQRIATIAPEHLQKFFFDTPITITTTRADNVMELNIYAGASTRATPAQRRLAEKLLDAYSRRAMRYFAALRTMYLYLEEKPLRARAMFTDIFDDKAEPAVMLSERELGMTREVSDAIESLLDDDEGGATSLDRIFDVVYNPLPAQLKIVVKGDVLAVEGLQKVESGMYEIHTPTAFEAIGALEGRWVSPDPIAIAANPDMSKKNAAELASMIDMLPRRAALIVSQSELSEALLAQMRLPPRFRLRWRVATPAPLS